MRIVFLLSISIVCCFAACKTITPTTVNEKDKFVPYQSIRDNTARLQALLAGGGVQHRIVIENEKEVYKTWKINDDKDSIMMYNVPVGEPNKDGYHLFQYQIMTSLPDEPVYMNLERLQTVDRDTIKSIQYIIPSDFKITLEELIKNKRKFFEMYPVSTWEDNPVQDIYLRKDILAFQKRTDIFENNDSRIEAAFLQDIYDIGTEGYSYNTKYYNDTTLTEVVRSSSSLFKKQERFD